MDAKEKAGYMPEEDSLGLSLLEKGQQGLAHVVFSRLGIIVLLLLLQLLLLFTAFYWLNAYLPHFIIVSTLFSTTKSMSPTDRPSIRTGFASSESNLLIIVA